MDDTLDTSRLSDIFEDDRPAIVEVLHECSAYVRKAVGELEAAVRAGDVFAVSRAAHSIKGSCANVGALAFEREARAVEADARAGTIRADAATTFATLIERLDLAIARYAGGSAAS